MSNQEVSLESIKKEMSKILDHKLPERHSYFQLRYFLIGKEPTNQSKMWQCLRELKLRMDSLDSLELEYEEQKDKLEFLEIKEQSIQLTTDDTNAKESIKILASRENALNLRKITRKKTAVIASLSTLLDKKKYIEEESIFFLEMFETLQKTETLRDFDDVDAQKQYWQEKLSQKLNLKMLTGGQLDTELIETVIALPDDMHIKQQILQTLNIRHSQMAKAIEQSIKEKKD